LRGDEDAVRQLLNKVGGDPAHLEAVGGSSLELAAAAGHAGVVRLLLGVVHRDKLGSALELAAEAGHRDCCKCVTCPAWPLPTSHQLRKHR
jgi:hypothetical protein